MKVKQRERRDRALRRDRVRDPAPPSRRHFFSLGSTGIGTAALASLLNPQLFAGAMDANPKTGGLPGLPHFPPKAKRVIFLHQSGGPAQMDLFVYKPKLVEYRGKDLQARSGWGNGSPA